jgi:hypothetical protein
MSKILVRRMLLALAVLTFAAALPAAQPRSSAQGFRGFCRCGCSFVRDCNTSADCGGGACLGGPTCC